MTDEELRFIEQLVIDPPVTEQNQQCNLVWRCASSQSGNRLQGHIHTRFAGFLKLFADGIKLSSNLLAEFPFRLIFRSDLPTSDDKECRKQRR